jgi:hypothetical protein
MSVRVSALALACAAFPWVAHAEPGGTSGVSSPAVTEGDIKLEWRSTAWDGEALDGDWSHRAQGSYGVTDWWRAQLNLRASQPDDGDFEFRTIGVENAFEFTATNDWPVQFGGQIEYKFGLDDVEDSVELKLLAERRAGPFTARFNIAAERAVTGDSDEWSHVYSTRLMWRPNDTWQFGVEGFSEPEENAHYFGPRAGVRLGEATLSVGYLAGIDEAQADAQIRLSLEWAP